MTVVGFDEFRDLIIVNDPAAEKLARVPTTEFLRKWHLGRSDAILVVPKSRVRALDPELAGKDDDLTGFLKAYGDLKDGRVEVALSGFRRISDRRMPFLLWILLGDIYIDMRRFTEARDVLKKAATQRPKDPLLWQSLARLADKLADRDGAIEFATKAIELAGNRYQFANIVLASIYFNDGQLERARRLFSESIQISPNVGAKNYMAHYYLGVVQFAQGEVEEALTSFRKSAESMAGFSPAWNAIERFSHYQQADVGRKEADAVLEHLLLVE